MLLRNPGAVRPWQHVLEPLMAYLTLAAKMTEEPQRLASAYNIGPEADDVLDVETVTRKFIGYYGKGSYEIARNTKQPHEAQLLLLDNGRIKEAIGLQPRFNAEEAIKMTATWYADKERSATEKCMEQITGFLAQQR